MTNNGSSLIIENGGLLRYFPNSSIILNGPNAVLEIRGTLETADNATFTFSGGSAGSGKVILNCDACTGTWVSENITYGSGSRIELAGTGREDVMLEVRQESFYARGNGTGPDLVNFHDGTILMEDGARLFVGSPLSLVNVHIRSASLSAGDAYSTTHNHRGLEVFGQAGVNIGAP